MQIMFSKFTYRPKVWFHWRKPEPLWEGVPCQYWETSLWILKRWCLSLQWEVDYDINKDVPLSEYPKWTKKQAIREIIGVK